MFLKKVLFFSLLFRLKGALYDPEWLFSTLKLKF